MIAFRTLRDFQASEWTFNTETREWTNKTGVIKLAIDRNENGS
jgi:hypothetical protein